ncbi:MAG TPA: CBS domain-containing protein [Ilumatobacteraceae bacterium]
MSDQPALVGPGAPISTYTTDEIVTLDPSATVRAAAELIDAASVGCIVIGSAAAVEGVVSERDIVRFVASGGDPDSATVGELETKHLMWTTPDSTVGAVAEEMMQNYVRHVLVGDGTNVVGIVSMRDVITAYVS